MLSFDLSEEQQMIRDTVGAFARARKFAVPRGRRPEDGAIILCPDGGR